MSHKRMSSALLHHSKPSHFQNPSGLASARTWNDSISATKSFNFDASKMLKQSQKLSHFDLILPRIFKIPNALRT